MGACVWPVRRFCPRPPSLHVRGAPMNWNYFIVSPHFPGMVATHVDEELSITPTATNRLKAACFEDLLTFTPNGIPARHGGSFHSRTDRHDLRWEAASGVASASDTAASIKTESPYADSLAADSHSRAASTPPMAARHARHGSRHCGKHDLPERHPAMGTQ